VNAAVWLAAGTAAGVFVGVLLADRFGGGKLLERLSGLLKVSGVNASDDEFDDTDQAFDEYGAEIPDDDGADDTPGVDERVLAAFQQDPILSERAIEIDADDPGTVVLRGTVPSAEDAAHALIIARGTPGVSKVENLLRVRASRSRPVAERSPTR
jgi:osmotically-inducible protein OsmY